MPQGELGELCIAGAGLSDGYWSDAERTAESFVEIEDATGELRRVYRTGDMAKLGEDGLLHFHGRRDSQIKSRGYRIELGDIEHALQSLDIVRDVYPDQAHPNVVESKRALMELYAAWNRPDQVERYRVPPGRFIAY